MYNILQEIFRSDFARCLAFKGGTAAYFLYDLDRFSTDLDFDVIGDVENLDAKIIEILKKYGTVKLKRKIILSYSTGEDNLKIDISRKVWKNNQYKLINFFGTDMYVQDKKTLFTNKLVALTERNTNRDIYDVYFFLKKGFEVNEALIQERTGAGYKQILSIIINKLDSLGPKYKTLDGLGEVLTPKQKTFVKQHLIHDLIGQLSMAIQFE